MCLPVSRLCPLVATIGVIVEVTDLPPKDRPLIEFDRMNGRRECSCVYVCVCVHFFVEGGGIHILRNLIDCL